MMTIGETMRKITISLPEELVEFADHQAKALNTSRSQVIGMALAAVEIRPGRTVGGGRLPLLCQRSA